MPNSAAEIAARAARARLASASELDTLIGALAVAYAAHQKHTSALAALLAANDRAALSLNNALSMRLSQAGFGPLLARNFAGPAPSLSEAVERQHAKLGIGG